MRASGVSPRSAAHRSDARTNAAPPSVMPDDDPAVMIPVCPSTLRKSQRQFRQRLERRAVPRMFVASRTPWTRLLCASSAGNVIGAISRRKCPAFCAASAFCWLSSANWSDSSRVMPYCRARTSAVSPMIRPESGSWKPSRYIASTKREVAHAMTPTRIGAVDEIRHATHRLDAARDDTLRLAEQDALRSRGNRLHSRGARFVDRLRGGRERACRRDGRPAGPDSDPNPPGGRGP